MNIYDNPAKYTCKCVIWTRFVLHTSKRVRITHNINITQLQSTAVGLKFCETTEMHAPSLTYIFARGLPPYMYLHFSSRTISDKRRIEA